MLKNLHHVGVIVKSLDNAVKRYSDILQLDPSKVPTFNDNRVKLGFLKIGDNIIELIEPTATGNRFAKHLKEKGEGLFHLSMYSDNYDLDIRTLKEKGYKLEEEIVSPEVKMAWLSPENTGGIWIEVINSAGLPPDSKK